MIALSRKTAFSHVVKTFHANEATNLFDVAHLGDTIHKVPDAPHTGEELMKLVNEQLLSGSYKEVKL